jgi:hypothetical protein
LPVGFYVLASDRRHRDFPLGLDLQKCLQIIKAVNIWHGDNSCYDICF